LHPRALIPIAGTRIVLHVRSFMNPEARGTEISARRSLPTYPSRRSRSFMAAIVTVAGKEWSASTASLRVRSTIEAERLSVSTIFQASSESSIGFTLPEAEADRAVRGVQRAFRHELGSGLIDRVFARPGMAVVAVVGDGLAGSPGIAARVFSALASGGIHVVAIAQGRPSETFRLL
jgi:aspartokinase/homoserine dehydrogenase 1